MIALLLIMALAQPPRQVHETFYFGLQNAKLGPILFIREAKHLLRIRSEGQFRPKRGRSLKVSKNWLAIDGEAATELGFEGFECEDCLYLKSPRGHWVSVARKTGEKTTSWAGGKPVLLYQYTTTNSVLEIWSQQTPTGTRNGILLHW